MYNFLLRLSWQLIKKVESQVLSSQAIRGKLDLRNPGNIKTLMVYVLVVFHFHLSCRSIGGTVACLVKEKPRRVDTRDMPRALF